VERLTNTVVSRAKWFVCYTLKLRVLNHLLAITCCHGYWSFNAVLFAFEQREKLMEFYERVCGARMHSAYFRPGGVGSDRLDYYMIFMFGQNSLHPVWMKWKNY
jgi:NADH-quinone oxidoreductase subunit D